MPKHVINMATLVSGYNHAGASLEVLVGHMAGTMSLTGNKLGNLQPQVGKEGLK